MKQENIFLTTPQACAFTGHRDLSSDFKPQKLRKVIRRLVNDGVATFYCGMAIGFDLLAAEILLKIKKKHPEVKLVACLPCQNQDKYFSETDKLRYAACLAAADEIVCLSDHYYNGCMQVRDKYMAERADILVAYCRKTTGGTAYTIRCFEKFHPDGELVEL